MITSFDFLGRHPGAVADVLRLVREQAQRGEFILRSAVADFERGLCEATGARHAVCTSSGTAGLVLALKARDIGPGDEVIVPALCYVAVASAVAFVGARPVFVDVDARRYTLDPEAVRRALTERTRAVMPAHVFSALADLPALRAAIPDDVAVIEDAATAFGARDPHTGRAAGHQGDLGVLSFFPAKPLGGLGDGGAILTDDEHAARRMRQRRNHGQDGITRFLHHVAGHNLRMDEINARWLTERLADVDDELAHKRALARRYDEGLAPFAPRLTCQERGTDLFSPHAYVVRHTARDGLRSHLTARGIETRVHFAAALPDQPAFAAAHGDGGSAPDVPVARTLARELVALPLHPAMRPEQVDTVVAAVAEFLS